MKTLEDLQYEEKELRKKLTEVQQLIKNAKLHKFEVEYGVRIGSIVKVKIRGQEVEYEVTEIETKWKGKPWLKGRKRKKNGEFSKSIHYIWEDWVVLKEAEQ